jgi:cAMP-dependent protein kinase regulator
MAMRYPPLPPSADVPPPVEAPGVRTSESPVDHALTLLLAGEIDAALRWAAAALERTASLGALVVTARLLDQMGRSRAAVDGLRLAVHQAVDASNLPLAVAAIDDIRHMGIDASELLDYVATSFCRGSSRLTRGDLPLSPPSPAGEFVQPLSAFLAGPALASRATQILQNAKRAYDDTVGAEAPRITPLPAFSALSREALYDLLAAFQAVTVPAGHRIIQEGVEGTATYVVARGEVEISRRAANRTTPGDSKFTLALARLGSGAFFGEMAMMSALPSPSSATATRPSILLVGKRDALAAVAANRQDVAAQLAAHCRRNSLANLGWTSPVVAAVPPMERSSMVERLEMRIFEKGDRLVTSGEDASGMHVVVSGEVAIVAREWDERVLLATLGAGETVGEMELVLCRQSFSDAIAIRPTATLFLSRDEYTALVQDHPAILHGLYAIAVQRHAETSFALQSGSSVAADDWLLEAADGPGSRPPPFPIAGRATYQGLPVPEAPQAEHSIPTRRPSRLPAPRLPPVPPPLPLSHSKIPASAPSTAESIRPTATSAAPPAPTPSFVWIGPAAAGAAAAALAAGLAIVLMTHSRQPATAGATMSPPTHEAPAPATQLSVVSPQSAAVALAPAPATTDPTAPATAAPTAPNAAPRANKGVAAPIKAASPPKAAVVVRPEPLPVRPRAAASAASVVAAASASAAGSPLPARAASGAEAPPVASGLASGQPASDEFGGRQ